MRLRERSQKPAAVEPVGLPVPGVSLVCIVVALIAAVYGCITRSQRKIKIAQVDGIRQDHLDLVSSCRG